MGVRHTIPLDIDVLTEEKLWDLSRHAGVSMDDMIKQCVEEKWKRVFGRSEERSEYYTQRIEELNRGSDIKKQTTPFRRV